MDKLPISVMIVGYNEDRFLRQCLDSVNFCDEILYTDLGSTDQSVHIAQQYTDKIYFRDRKLVPSCEMVQTEVVHFAKNEWIIFIDPDEKIDISLCNEIKQNFLSFCMDKKLGAIKVPWQFYFKEHKLLGTVWGGINYKFLLVNRNRFKFDPIIHYGRKLVDGFQFYTLPYNGNNVLHHYWMNSYKVFLKKHLRYLKNEGTDQLKLGIRSGYKKIMTTPFKEFYASFITMKGYKDLVLGFGLSLFWAYYKTHIAVDMLVKQRNTE